MNSIDELQKKSFVDDYFGGVVLERPGKSLSFFLRVKVWDDCTVSIAQTFGSSPTLYAEWKWNSHGRIRRTSFHIRDTTSRHKVPWNYTVSCQDPLWNTYEFEVYNPVHLALHAGSIDRALIGRDSSSQFVRLLRFGHNAARQLESALVSGKVYDVPRLAPQQVPLTLSVHDDSLRSTLRSIGALHADSSGGGTTVVLKYRPHFPPARLSTISSQSSSYL